MSTLPIVIYSFIYLFIVVAKRPILLLCSSDLTVATFATLIIYFTFIIIFVTQEEKHMRICVRWNLYFVSECYCGKSAREVVCTAETTGVSAYTCENLCEKSRDCEQHQCEEPCHPGDCLPCLLTPARVTTCPCGQTPLEKLYERDGVAPRTSCLDPVPTCGMTCSAKLPCGPPANPHTCTAVCHSGI